MKLVRLACLLPLLLASALVADEHPALQDGEQLTYRVAWGIFGHAGEIRISADAEVEDNVPYLAVRTTTETRGVLRRLFPFEAQAEGIFDQRSGRLLLLSETSASSKKKTNTTLKFDYERAIAEFTDYLNTTRNRTVPVPADSAPMDLITSLIHTRTWDLKPGDSRDISVVFEKDLYLLTVHAIGYEIIDTRIGRFRTLLLEPRMEKMPPKGMFKRGSTVRVWIAQDDPRRIPVRFAVEFKFGAGIATIADYDPPPAALAATEAPAPLPSNVTASQ